MLELAGVIPMSRLTAREAYNRSVSIDTILKRIEEASERGKFRIFIDTMDGRLNKELTELGYGIAYGSGNWIIEWIDCGDGDRNG